MNRRHVALCTLVILAWAAVHLTLLGAAEASPAHGRLTDTDSYMRLVRITELVDGDGWYDNVIERSNAPYGDELHWTRPLDVLVIAGAGPLLPFLDRHDALFWSGAAICPLLHLVALFAIAWAAAPLLGPRSPLLVAAFLVQPALLSVFGPGKLDHHALQIVLFVFLVGLGVRLLRKAGGWWMAALAGTVAGLGIWVSVEMVVPLLILHFALGIWWLTGRKVASALGLCVALGSAVSVAAALLIERPLSDLGSAELDRVSIVYLTALALCAAFWGMIAAASSRKRLFEDPRSRLALAVTCGLVVGGAFALAFPRALLGPEADIDPAIRPIWLDKVGEMRSLVPTSALNAGLFLLLVGQSLIALPVLLLVLRRTWGGPSFGAWTFVGALFAVYLLLSIQHARAATFLAVVVSVLVTEGLMSLRGWLSRVTVPQVRGLTWAGATVGSVAGFLVLGGAVTAATTDRGPEASDRTCYIDQIAPFLSDPGGLGASRKIVAASIDFGPEILYFTPHSILAGPYHRNAEGILALYQVLNGTPEQALDVVRERGVDLVLLCPSPQERAFVAASPGSLDAQLMAGVLPGWLEPIEVPASAANRFLLFRVRL